MKASSKLTPHSFFTRAVRLLFVALVFFATGTLANANTDELAHTYYFLDEYYSANGHQPPTVNISSGLSGRVGELWSANQFTFDSPIPLDEIDSDGWYLYVVYFSETVSGPGFHVKYSHGGSTSHNWAHGGTKNIAEKEVDNLFIIMMEGSCIGMQSANGSCNFPANYDAISWEIKSTGCSTYCNQPIGVVFSKQDASSTIAASTTDEDIYDLFRYLIETNGSREVIQDITTDTTWSGEEPYVISGNLEIPAGVTLNIEPGVVVKFDTSTSSSLTVNGNLVAEGGSDSSDQIYLTSFKDDAVPAIGDTNNDSSTTVPAAGDWGGIIVNSGGLLDFEYVTVRYAGDGNDSNIKNNGGVINIASSTIAYSENYGVRNTAGTTTVTASDIGFNDYGLYLSGGSLSVTASSTIHDNDSYGIYNSTTHEIDVTNNWWATSTGPYHATTNTGGDGDTVSDYVDFTPWIGERHYLLIDDCHSYGICGSTPNNAVLLWAWASGTAPIYSDELGDAIDVWNDESRVDIQEATSTSNVLLFASSTDDSAWSGIWYFGVPGEIHLNSYYLDEDTPTQVQHTIMHEFGHALGLGHSYTGNLMYFNQTSLIELGVQDKLDYYYLWP